MDQSRVKSIQVFMLIKCPRGHNKMKSNQLQSRTNMIHSFVNIFKAINHNNYNEVMWLTIALVDSTYNCKLKLPTQGNWRFPF